MKLNMAMGKGELALRGHGEAGQEVIRAQLQEVEDAWATLLVSAMSCHRYSCPRANRTAPSQPTPWFHTRAHTTGIEPRVSFKVN